MIKNIYKSYVSSLIIIIVLLLVSCSILVVSGSDNVKVNTEQDIDTKMDSIK